MGLIFSLAQKGCVSLSFLSGDFMKYKNLGRSFFFITFKDEFFYLFAIQNHIHIICPFLAEWKWKSKSTSCNFFLFRSWCIPTNTFNHKWKNKSNMGIRVAKQKLKHTCFVYIGIIWPLWKKQHKFWRWNSTYFLGHNCQSVWILLSTSGLYTCLKSIQAKAWGMNVIN